MIVPARDSEGTLARALAALASQTPAGEWELIVVDNGSRDRTAPIAQSSEIVTHVISRRRGEGPGPARHAGAMAASGRVLAFLDADCWATPGWLAAGLAAARGGALVQGRVLPDPDAKLGPFDRTLSVGASSALFESANLFVPRELYERVGGFGPGLERPAAGWHRAPFGEDVIFGWQARRAGGRTLFSPEALVYHAVSPRGPAAYIAERLRLSLFPELVREVPELRNQFFYRGMFHSRRSAEFDLAVSAITVAMRRRHAAAVLGGLPYALTAAREARRWGGRQGAQVALVQAAADAVGAAALVAGSLRSGRLLL